MKFPSIFRTATPSRFEIKPRYYDPVREEVKRRTERIQAELQAGAQEEGLSDEERVQRFRAGIKGAFAEYQGIRPRERSIFASAAMIRTIIFLLLVGGLAGYIYLGQVVFEYLLYGIVLIAAIYFLNKLRTKV